MKKWSVIITAIVVAVLLINLVSWFTAGRDTALLIAVESFDSAGAVVSGDTLYVFTGLVPELEPQKQIGSISEDVQHQFARRLQAEAGVAVVLLHPGSFEINDSQPITYSDSEAAFFASVERSLPMYAVVQTVVYAPGFVVAHKKTGIWFFGWRLISDQLDSIS